MWSPRLLPSSDIQERTFGRQTRAALDTDTDKADAGVWPWFSEPVTHRLRDGEHFPAGGVDGNEPRGEQLLILCAVASVGVQDLINADLEPNNGAGVTITLRNRPGWWSGAAGGGGEGGAYLAEMLSVERQSCLRPQLEEMELGGEDLLRTGNRGQTESVLHLFTAHWKWSIASLKTREKKKKERPHVRLCVFTHQIRAYVCQRSCAQYSPPEDTGLWSRRPHPQLCCTNQAYTEEVACGRG